MFRKALPLLALIPLAISAYALQQAWFGALALIAYGIACGLALGPRFAPEAPRPTQLGIGGLVTLALTSILGSLVYYCATITVTNLFIVLAVVSGIATAFAQSGAPIHTSRPTLTSTDVLIFSTGMLSLIGWWLAMFAHPITTPIRSLWLSFPPTTLIAIGIAIMCSLVLSLRQAPNWMCALLLGSTLFSALILAATLYPQGFGFDPFLHRATVNYIAEHGTITPKPLYYIGQYALELMGVKIFALPLFVLDTWLAPALAAWGIVLALLARQSADRSSTLLLGAVICLPLAAFVQTTPQALAFAFTAIALCLPPKPFVAPLLFALAALITHPLAGIGAAVYVTLLGVDALIVHKPYKTAATLLVVCLSSGALPVAFSLQAALSHLPLHFSLAHVLNISQLPLSSFFGSAFSFWGDVAYFFIGNAFIFVIMFGLIGLFLTPKHTPTKFVPALTALVIFINFVILSLGFDFSYLISYERSDFALRLLTLCSLCWLPYIARLATELRQKLVQQPVSFIFGCLSLATLLFTSNVYAAYPRHDNYARSAGFNLGPTDIDTVYAIDRYANNQTYLVLSDQALAAAAVQELGFKHYYHDNIFFYPIPTGGPLYQLFLNMVEQTPSRDIMDSAMALTGADQAFFAIHDYWWQAPEIIENSKTIADDWFSIGDGQITIFVFKRSP